MTQCERILEHMQQHGSITQLEAMNDYGIMRLSSRVNDLKRAGYNITSTIETGRNRYGETTHFAKYTLQEGA